MNNVMIDIETLGTGPTSVIISIGAVKFSNDGVDTDASFYRTIDLSSCFARGLTIDADTVAWWLNQSQPARAVFGQASQPIGTVLHLLNAWLPDDAIIWGNGADFDNAILAHAYRACGIAQPWKFWNNRCYRTIKSMHRQIPLERSGIHHNALDDATAQAAHLVSIANEVGIAL